jgi:hypothetical protein
MQECLHPRDKLIRRGPSQRENEYLFTCGVCGEKVQGRKASGYMTYYQTKKPSTMEKKSIMTSARVYPSKVDLLRSKGGTQAIIDRELEQ